MHLPVHPWLNRCFRFKNLQGRPAQGAAREIEAGFRLKRSTRRENESVLKKTRRLGEAGLMPERDGPGDVYPRRGCGCALTLLPRGRPVNAAERIRRALASEWGQTNEISTADSSAPIRLPSHTNSQ